MKSNKFTFWKENIGRSWYKFSRNKLSVIGLALFILLILAAILAPFITPFPKHAGNYVDLILGSQAPDGTHLLGTDIYGRDMFSRIIFALRPALLMGIMVLALVVPIGTILGLIAGYHKGKFSDHIIMRFTDIFLGLPPLILALAVSSILKPTLTNSMIAVSVAFWPWYSRLVYNMVISIKNEHYVISSELLGESKIHILFKEILPNCLSPIFTKMTLDFGWVIIMTASLSFVGLGEQPPDPSLGTMVAEGARLLPDKWWVAIYPAFTIVLMVLSLNLIGDGVRDMFTATEE